MRGRFIIVEGVNGVGKTSTLNKALSTLNGDHFGYSKGFTNNFSWDRFINSRPHSFTYYLDLVYKTAAVIRPTLMQGRHIIQDRYVQTVDSFLPDCESAYNKAFRILFNPLFLEPDLYIHFYAEVDTIAARLRASATDDYRLDLAVNPDKIKERESRYKQIYDTLARPKHVLNTTEKPVEGCANELIDIIRRELKCL